MASYDRLIKILLDKNVSLAKRDNAAMNLGQYTQVPILFALIEVARDNSEDETLLASCGESIGKIMLRCNLKSTEVLTKLAQSARIKAEGIIEAKSCS